MPLQPLALQFGFSFADLYDREALMRLDETFPSFPAWPGQCLGRAALIDSRSHPITEF